MTSIFEIIFIFLVLWMVVENQDRFRNWVDAWRHRRRKQPSDPAESVTAEKIQQAMKHRTFGAFTVPPAVVFFKAGDDLPQEGYKVRKHVLPNGRFQYQAIVSVSAEKLLDLFDALLPLLGEYCHVVLQDFGAREGELIEYVAYQKDTVIVRSILCDFEELLLNDGLIGLAVYSDIVRAEVQLTQQKVIQIFALDLIPFRRLLQRYGIEENPKLKFLFEDFHLLVEQVHDRMILESLKERLCVENMTVQSNDSDVVYN